VACSGWWVPVRTDQGRGPFDLKFYGRLRSIRTPLVNVSVTTLGS
jgi:hypothetical protein